MRPSVGPGFVDDPREQVEVEHAGLARARDAGFGRAARLEARDVAGGRALDVEPLRESARRSRSRCGGGSSGPSGSFSGQSPQKLEPPALMSARSCDGDRSAPDVGDRRGARIAEHALGVRIGAAAHHAAVAEQDADGPRPRAGEAGREVIQGHAGAYRVSGSDVSALGLAEFSQIRFELVVLVLHLVEEQALGEVRACAPRR